MPTPKLVLNEGVVIVPVGELAEDLRRQLGAADGDFAVSRPKGRYPAKIISAELCRFLRGFHAPRRIADAVVEYAARCGAPAEELLEEVFPVLKELLDASFLVDEDRRSGAPEAVQPGVGNTVGPFTIVRRIQVMDDSTVSCARSPGGAFVALKVVSETSGAGAAKLLEEASLFERLGGLGVPNLVASGESQGTTFLATEWVFGSPADRWADALRALEPGAAGERLLGVCTEIASVYSGLHRAGIVHGDVHPRNVLITRDDGVRLIDLGLSRRLDGGGRHKRGGIGFYFEPEFAAARLAGRNPPQATAAGEQYALGALLFRLMTGNHYVSFSYDKETAYRQILELAPRPFQDAGAAPWPAVEDVFRRMMSKSPSDRFPSVDAAFRALRSAGSAVALPRPVRGAAREIEAYLSAYLAEVRKCGSSVEIRERPCASVAMGLSGTAYGLYRIAVATADPELLGLADQFAERAHALRDRADAFYTDEDGLTQDMLTPLSVLYAGPGISVVRACVAHARGDAFALNAALQAFVRETEGIQDGSLDFAFGKPGVLSACADLVRIAACHSYVDGSAVRALGSRLDASIVGELEERFSTTGARPLLSGFLGAAHGWAGTLIALLKWRRSTGLALPGSVGRALEELGALAVPFDRGLRWPRKLPATPVQYLASWCNGSAGFVHLWAAASQASADDRYRSLAEGGAWAAFETADAALDLCCGTAGRAYALLAFHDLCKDKVWYERARALTLQAVRRAEPSRFMRAFGLYKGPVGLAVLCSELLCERPSQPMFGLEP